MVGVENVLDGFAAKLENRGELPLDEDEARELTEKTERDLVVHVVANDGPTGRVAELVGVSP